MKNSFSRREFVYSGAALAAAASAPMAGFAMTPDTEPVSPIRLGIASYTFRNFSRSILIQSLKTLKVSTVNCKDVMDHLPADTAGEDSAIKAYKAAGITITAAGTITFDKDEDDDIRKKFEYLKRAGIKVVVAGGPTQATLMRIEKFVKEYDIKFALHNHGPEENMGWHSPLDVLKVVKNMDPRMGCCVDVGHCARAGVNPVDAIKAVGPRVFDLHVKDLKDYTSRESQVDVGDGIIPFREIFATLVALKYQGNVDLEYEINGENPMPGVIKSFSYMRGVLAGMGYKA